MKLTESLIEKLIQEIFEEEGEESKEKEDTPGKEDAPEKEKESPPEDKETDFQELPIDIPSDPFKVKESKIKIKDLMSENFWNQVSQMNGWEAPPKERRWSKSINDSHGGLTEFEANKGGKDYVKEGPSYEYANHMKKIEKAENNQAKEVNNLVKLLQKKGLKKEATKLASEYMKGMRDFNDFLTKMYRKLV